MKKYNELFNEKGEYITDEKYQEIHVLERMLTEAGIPHTMEKVMDGWQVFYPCADNRKRVCDAIEYLGSYGYVQDKIEIMGLLTVEEQERSSVLGDLTAENVFERIKKHFNEKDE